MYHLPWLRLQAKSALMNFTIFIEIKDYLMQNGRNTIIQQWEGVS